jgi:hypothetical protein
MEKVYVYKNSYGDYRVHPGVVVVTGGEKLRIVNASGATLKVVVPAGASKPGDDVEIEIPAEDQGDIKSRSQGSGKTRAYSYKVATKSGQKKAHGNSDPVLIIEN